MAIAWGQARNGAIALVVVLQLLAACTVEGAGPGFILRGGWQGATRKIFPNGTIELSRVWHDQGEFQTKSRYLHGEFNFPIQLPGGYSAGIVTTAYLISTVTTKQGYSHRDEIDFEFLGAQDGWKYKVHTNYFAKGIGHHEEQINLWFDPTSGYHTYKIWWTWEHVVWFVDGRPIRMLKRVGSSVSVPAFPSKPMTIQGSVWDGSDFATDGGKTRANYQYAPFRAFYAAFRLNVCTFVRSKPPACASPSHKNTWDTSVNTAFLKSLFVTRYQYLHYSYMVPFANTKSAAAKFG